MLINKTRDTAHQFFRRYTWIPIAVFVFGTTLAWLEFDRSQKENVTEAQERFDIRVTELIAGMARRIDTNVEVLRGLNGLFAASEDVSREEFKVYYDHLKLSAFYPGIQGVGFAALIKPDRLAEFEAQMVKRGINGFTVTPVGERDIYTSIVYLEPFDWRNQRAFGFDMYSEPTRRAAMRLAVETGEATLSGKVRLVQETENDVQAGFLVYLPTYKKDLPLRTPEERWAAFEGWTYSPLRAGNLINSFLNEEFETLRSQIDLRVYAGSTPDDSALLFATDNPIASTKGLAPIARTIELYGTQWRVEISPRSGQWLIASDQSASLWQLVGGIFISTLLALFISFLNSRNQQITAALRISNQARDELAKSEAELRLSGEVIQASPMAIFVTDARGKIITVNPAFEETASVTEAETIGQSIFDLLITSTNSATAHEVWSTVTTAGKWEGEIAMRGPNGEGIPIEMKVTQILDKDGNVTSYAGLFSNIAARRSAESRIRFLAHHDYLTGLPNRALFQDRAKQMLASARRYKVKPALIFLDLDKFKPINDEHGHDVGDKVLRVVGKRLSDLMRDTDIVARLGGDEFVIMLPDYEDKNAIHALSERVLEKIRKPIEIDSLTLHVGASIGVALYESDAQTLDEMIHTADSNMYEAKSASDTHIVMT